jgi:hypothetical protein
MDSRGDEAWRAAPGGGLLLGLALERGEEALAHRVVLAVAHRVHRRERAGLPAAGTEGLGGGHCEP